MTKDVTTSLRELLGDREHLIGHLQNDIRGIEERAKRAEARALSAEGEVERLKAELLNAAQYLVRLEAALRKDDLDMRIDFDEAGGPCAFAEQLVPGFNAVDYEIGLARLSIGKGNGEGIPGPVTNADAACSLRETLVPGEEV